MFSYGINFKFRIINLLAICQYFHIISVISKFPGKRTGIGGRPADIGREASRGHNNLKALIRCFSEFSAFSENNKFINQETTNPQHARNESLDKNIPNFIFIYQRY